MSRRTFDIVCNELKDLEMQDTNFMEFLKCNHSPKDMSLPSIILPCVMIEQHISADKAITQACLEKEFWGRVEWGHDMNQQELQSRLAAAILFVHFNMSKQFTKEKLV